MTIDADPREALWGWEWDFVATDTVGHLAILSSSGYGLIPPAVLASREEVERAVALVDAMLPTTSAVPAQPHRDGNYSDWYAYSARGFFAYDWRTHHGPYELISSPAEPITLAALPALVRSAAALSTIPQPFSELAELQLPDL